MCYNLLVSDATDQLDVDKQEIILLLYNNFTDTII